MEPSKDTLAGFPVHGMMELKAWAKAGYHGFLLGPRDLENPAKYNPALDPLKTDSGLSMLISISTEVGGGAAAEKRYDFVSNGNPLKRPTS